MASVGIACSDGVSVQDAAGEAGDRWDRCLAMLESTLTRPTFEICLRGSSAVVTDSNRLQITVSHGSALDWMRNRPRPNVKELARLAVAEVYGRDFVIEWVAPTQSSAMEDMLRQHGRGSHGARGRAHTTVPGGVVVTNPASPMGNAASPMVPSSPVSPTASPVSPVLPPASAAVGSARMSPALPMAPASSASVPSPASGSGSAEAAHSSRSRRALAAELAAEKHRFDNFVLGPSNQLAFQAARQVAEHPGTCFNPLVIYGNAGLGKTHLIKAVRHHVLTNKPDMRVVYASSESFTNELVESLHERKSAAFRRKYRHVDVLLIDDVEFLIGKERIQEEFYHTFEELAARGKQLILTSDRPPHLLTALQERLCSRLSSGLIADVQPPTLAMRMEIVRRLAAESEAKVPEDVISFIAENFAGNVRLLEGAMVRVMAFAGTLLGQRIDLEVARRALDGMLVKQPPQMINLALILEKVSEYYRVPVADLTGPRRDRRYSAPRHVAMYLAQELAAMRCREIGDAFGGKDYSTISHAIKKIEATRTEPGVANDLKNLAAMLGRNLA
jgi:chromosomal replication initiator protein